MVGLFFGSFNPIHIGHTALAKHLLENTVLDEVWLVVSPHNPLKEEADLLSDELRLQMVKLAIADKSNFRVCDIEFSLPTPSYTIQTLEKLQEIYPEKTFALLIGADNLAVFNQWKDYQLLLSNFQILVYPREGIDVKILQVIYPQVKLVEAALYPISSTEIRRIIREGKDAGKWLHPAVEKFIKEKGLYKS